MQPTCLLYITATFSLLIAFFVGGSKELAVLYESYSTATFVMQRSFVLYRLKHSYNMDSMCCMSNKAGSRGTIQHLASPHAVWAS